MCMAGDGSFSKTSVILSIIPLVVIFLLILLITIAGEEDTVVMDPYRVRSANNGGTRKILINIATQEDKVVTDHDRVWSPNDGGTRKILITVAAQEDKVVTDHDRVRSANDGGTRKMDGHGATEKERMDAHRTAGIPSTSWGERLFNASAHEVPSGPNPISNR